MRKTCLRVRMIIRQNIVFTVECAVQSEAKRTGRNTGRVVASGVQ